MGDYHVTASGLWLRSTPSNANDANKLMLLLQAESVTVSDATDPNWYKVVPDRAPSQQGYAAARYLAKQADYQSDQISLITTPIHLTKGSKAMRTNRNSYACALSELNLPTLNKASVATKIDSIHAIVSYLQVDTSERYQVKDKYTYCNIYAYDFCYLTGAFLPRVWWNDKPLALLIGGTPVDAAMKNLHEVRANDLFYWLCEWGDDFGWVRVYDLDTLQQQVNLGKPGLISGRNKDANRSGHICCVIPESGSITANRVNNKIITPLCSQAGAKNFRLNNNDTYRNYAWWISSSIIEHGYWYWDAP